MYWRLLGVILLSLSLITGGIIAAKVEVPHRIESFAEGHVIVKSVEKNVELKDIVVNVPPRNSSEGWIGGINVTLPNRSKPSYEAYGIILPNDGDKHPDMMMVVVNETGLIMLKWDQFSPDMLNTVKKYTAAKLNETWLHFEFRFTDLDTSSKYIFLFRSLKNETASRPILISLKEAWYEEDCLLPSTPFNIGIVAVTASLGLIVIIKSFQHPKKHPKKTHVR